eukprot:295030-Chlamydomonas_euryale.AAC.8
MTLRPVGGQLPGLVPIPRLLNPQPHKVQAPRFLTFIARRIPPPSLYACVSQDTTFAEGCVRGLSPRSVQRAALRCFCGGAAGSISAPVSSLDAAAAIQRDGDFRAALP